ncbi:MAG TPA: fluoride efflux transporter CrcB [Xanthomonadales bacterium]|nr:fluoride efflux transporter CrcB [Xanthomonadales bacterium]
MNAAISYAALVGAGGFFGALARYGLAGLVEKQFPLGEFPLGTLVVNLLGCFLIGLLGGLAESREYFGPEIRAFVLIGILGGFTTYSTFGFETLALLRNAEVLQAFSNVAIHVFAGLFLVWLGFVIVAWR